MELSFTVIAGLVGLMLVGGALIAVVGIRRAPDGFEDKEGCHLQGRRRNASS
jgi:hypothetical protein